MAGVIQFALGGSVGFSHGVNPDFPDSRGMVCSLVSTATSHWFPWVRIELHFRAAAAGHVEAQMMAAASPPGFLCRLSPRVAMVEAAQAPDRPIPARSGIAERC